MASWGNVVVLCLVLFCRVEGVYESNPFLNGNYNNNPGVGMPTNVVEMTNAPLEPQPEPAKEYVELRKYCQGPRGHYRSKYCNTFVDCWDDKAVEFTCPPPLYFSTEGFCDYPQNVKCDGKTIKPGVPFQPTNEISAVPPSAPVHYPSESSWPSDGSYKPPAVVSYPVQNGMDDGMYKPSQGGWDDGMYKPAQGGWDDGSYKPVQGSWDDGSYKPKPPTYPIIMGPPVKPPTYPIVTSPPVRPPTYPLNPPTTKPPVVTWPTLPPTQVVSTSKPTELPHLPADKYCKQPRGQFPGSACNKYVNCWDGIALEQECPEGLNFNPYKLYCDYSWNYNCKQHEVSVDPIIPKPPPVIPPVSPTSPPLLPANKFCKDHRGQFPGSACNKYINCWDGIAVEQECPEGYNFNPNKGYCDFPWNYNCNNNSGVPTTSSPVTQVPPIAVTVESFSHLLKYCLKPRGQFPGTSCGKYVDCWDGYVVEQDCPKGLIFNPIKCYCDYGPHPNCPRTTRNDNIPTGVTDPLLTCKTGTIFSLNEECSHVAICRNDLIEIVQCPQGLNYDAAKDSCMAPHLAKC